MTNFHVLKKTQVSTSERSFSALRCLKAYTLGTDSSPVISLCLSSPRGVWWERGNRGRVAQRHKNDWGQVSLRNTMKQDWLNFACLFTVTKHWLMQLTLLRLPRRSQAQTTKVCLRQETRFVAGWIGTFHFFYRHSFPHHPMEGYPM